MPILKEYKVYNVPVINSSKDCRVVKTASKIDLENFCNNIKVVRILTDYNSIFLWDAQELNHKDVSDNLVLNSYDAFWIENGILYWHFIIDNIKAKKFLSRWYPDKLNELDKTKRSIKLF